MASKVALSLLMGPEAVQPVPRGVIEALTDVGVQVNATDRSGFDLKFATSKRSVITTQLLPGGYFDPPARVVIAVTLSGTTSVLMDGVITHQEVVPSDEAGQSVLSIKGEDLTRMMDLTDETGTAFPGQADFQQVETILGKYLSKYRMVPQVIPSVLLDEPNPNQRIPTQQGTDLGYTKLLGDRIGYTFYIQPGPEPGSSTAYWGPKLSSPIAFLPKAAPLAIDWDGSTNVESLQFGFDGFQKTEYDADSKVSGAPVPVPINVPDPSPISPPLGAKNPPALKKARLPGLAKYPPIQAAGIALARTAESENVVRGSGSLDVLRYGSILNARTLVAVNGAGITYDGEYYVESCSHTIKAGSYKQGFSLMRNRLGGAGGSSGGAGGQQLSGFAPSGGVGAPLPAPGTSAVSSGSIVSSLPASP